MYQLAHIHAFWTAAMVYSKPYKRGHLQLLTLWSCRQWDHKRFRRCRHKLDSKCRVIKSLYARRVSDFCIQCAKVPQHLFDYFHNSFLLIKDDFFLNITMQILNIYKTFSMLKCDFIIQYSFNLCFLKNNIIIRKQMVSEHCSNQSIDKYINYIYQISPILQISTGLQDFLHVWFKFSFLYYVLCKKTGITSIVNFQVSRDLKQRNRVIILSFGSERHCFTIYQIFIPILEGSKNDLIETSPFVNVFSVICNHLPVVKGMPFR